MHMWSPLSRTHSLRITGIQHGGDYGKWGGDDDSE